MKTFFEEFKKFVAKGNVMDMAVGVIIGAAFKAIVDSLVNDLLNPILGMATGDGFSAWTVQIGSASLGIGAFIMAVINFLLMALVLFVIVKAMNSFKKPAPAGAPTTKECPYCKSQIPLQATRCPHCTSELDK